jgi:hypothetical protein
MALALPPETIAIGCSSPRFALTASQIVICGQLDGSVVPTAVVVAAVWWTSAPRRPWFWLLGAIPGVAFFLPDIPMIVAALTSPASVFEFVLSLVIIASVVVLVVSAVVAFRDARRATTPAIS